MSSREATHLDPVWRSRANFIIAVAIDPVDTDVGTEQLWARRIDNGQYEICCIPFFAYDLALGDIVDVDKQYLVRRVVKPSGRYVFRVHFGPTMLTNRDEVVAKLADVGALLEWSSPSLLAVDARDACHGQEVADLLIEQECRGKLVYETGRNA